MKYIKKYNENIDWGFDEDETPEIPEEFKGNEDFYNFLVENDILDKYIYNFNKRTYLKLYNFLNNELKNKYIIRAFNWGQTKEDGYFWKDIHRLWIKKISF